MSISVRAEEREAISLAPRLQPGGEVLQMIPEPFPTVSAVSLSTKTVTQRVKQTVSLRWLNGIQRPQTVDSSLKCNRIRLTTIADRILILAVNQEPAMQNRER
jgi:hypothetical protein